MGPNGDQKTHFGPHGDQSPQMGTNVGAVVETCCHWSHLHQNLDEYQANQSPLSVWAHKALINLLVIKLTQLDLFNCFFWSYDCTFSDSCLLRLNKRTSMSMSMEGGNQDNHAKQDNHAT